MDRAAYGSLVAGGSTGAALHTGQSRALLQPTRRHRVHTVSVLCLLE